MYRLSGGNKKKWTILKHNGPYFPEEYKPHNIPVIINENEIQLPKLAEEYITLYAHYLDTNYIKKSKFNKNFLIDFNKTLPSSLKLKSMNEININSIKKYLDKIKENKKKLSKEEKAEIKRKQDLIEEPYKYCIIDGARQKVGNYKIEPPGIFLGRGEHPKLGRIKRRIKPEDVTINLDKNSLIPKPNVPGKWGKIVHNKESIWLATWVDNITNKNKYIFTSMESIFKSKSDEKKFNLARQLKRKASKVRNEYIIDLESDSLTTKQLATAVYFIDNLALRVGGKKNIKEKADTVGVTSLRVEHLTLLPNTTIKLDFLGKDSIRYCKKVKVTDLIYRNLELFIINKSKKKQLFDTISSASLNNYLERFMKGLTAKVWRTYNASLLFQKELNKIKTSKIENYPEAERINYLVTFFNQANTAVALLCNHQKKATGNINKQLETLGIRLKKLRKNKKKYKEKKNEEMVKKIDAKINTLKLKISTKSKMKNVSLGTSKNNYIDPRIIFAFIKKYNIPEEKLFNKTLLKRFKWARNVSKDYKF